MEKGEVYCDREYVDSVPCFCIEIGQINADLRVQKTKYIPHKVGHTVTDLTEVNKK